MPFTHAEFLERIAEMRRSTVAGFVSRFRGKTCAACGGDMDPKNAGVPTCCAAAIRYELLLVYTTLESVWQPGSEDGSEGEPIEDPVCYCGSKMAFRTSQYGGFWGCERYPHCDGLVGVHKGTKKPLGNAANSATRKLRSRAHASFDSIWKEDHFSRSKAYEWLAGVMKLSVNDCHIGKFDDAQLHVVIQQSDIILAELRKKKPVVRDKQDEKKRIETATRAYNSKKRAEAAVPDMAFSSGSQAEASIEDATGIDSDFDDIPF